VVLIAARAHRGTGAPVNAHPPAGQVAVVLGQDAAHPYNPFGDSGVAGEHPEAAGAAIDNIPGTDWTTYHYDPGALEQKGGTGLYVDAKPGIAAVAAVIQTPTPGISVQIWASKQIANASQGTGTPSLAQRGWVEVGQEANLRSGARIPLDTANQRFRYYLLWITAVPGGSGAGEIDEFTLYKSRS
jgi:serine/threonine-protein kinase